MTIVWFWFGLIFHLLSIFIIYCLVIESRSGVKIEAKVVGYTTTDDLKNSFFPVVFLSNGSDDYYQAKFPWTFPAKKINEKLVVIKDSVFAGSIANKLSVEWIAVLFLTIAGFGAWLILFKTFSLAPDSLAMSVFISICFLVAMVKVNPSEFPEFYRGWQKLKTENQQFKKIEDIKKINWASKEDLSFALKKVQSNQRNVVVVTTLLSLLLFFSAWRFFKEKTRELEESPVAFGKVVSVEEVKSSQMGGGYTYRAILSIPIGDSEKRIKDPVSYYPAKYEVGESVRVRIPSDSDKDPYIDRGVWNYMVPIVLAILAALSVLLLVTILLNQKWGLRVEELLNQNG